MSRDSFPGKRLGVRDIGRQPGGVHTSLVLRPVRVSARHVGTQRQEEAAKKRRQWGRRSGTDLNVNVSYKVKVTRLKDQTRLIHQ